MASVQSNPKRIQELDQIFSQLSMETVCGHAESEAMATSHACGYQVFLAAQKRLIFTFREVMEDINAQFGYQWTDPQTAQMNFGKFATKIAELEGINSELDEYGSLFIMANGKPEGRVATSLFCSLIRGTSLEDCYRDNGDVVWAFHLNYRTNIDAC